MGLLWELLASYPLSFKLQQEPQHVQRGLRHLELYLFASSDELKRAHARTAVDLHGNGDSADRFTRGSAVGARDAGEADAEGPGCRSSRVTWSASAWRASLVTTAVTATVASPLCAARDEHVPMLNVNPRPSKCAYGTRGACGTEPDGLGKCLTVDSRGTDTVSFLAG